MLLKRLKRYV